MTSDVLCSESWQWERVGGRSEARPTTLERLRAKQPRGGASHTQTLTKEFTEMCLDVCANDPSAGSPTETLLRLLLPLNDKVWTASRGIAAGEPAASPQSGGLTGSFNR